jgi:transposase
MVELEAQEVSMKRKRYTEEFKAEAIKQVTERGYSVQDVSDRLGISTKSMYTWLRAAGRRRSNRDIDELDAVRRENIRLKNELKRVAEERDILKKAAAYFAKASG